MRFLFFLFLIYFSVSGQISKTTSYSSSGQLETSSFTYGSHGGKYISSTIYLPTGSLTKGINLTKVDACGEMLWSKTFFKTSRSIYQRQVLYQEEGKAIFVIGYLEDEGTLIKSLLVTKLSENGDIIFSKSYKFGDYLYGYMYENYVGPEGIDIHGKYPKIGGGFSHGALIRIGNQGEIIFANRFFDTYTGLSTIQMSDDSYLIRTASYLYLTHVDGTIYWAKQFEELLEGSNFFRGDKVDGGNVFIMGRQKEFYVAKFSDTGDFIWMSKKFSFEFRPQLMVNKKQEIVLISFHSKNGGLKPYFVSLNKEGEFLRSEIIDSFGVEINNYPFIHKTPENEISLLFSAENSTSVLISENISNSQCREMVGSNVIEHDKNDDYSNISPQLNPLISSSILDLDLETLNNIMSDSVRCEPIIIEDSLFIEAKIDCENGYFYSDGSENSTFYWPHDGSSLSTNHLDTAGEYILIVENCYSRTIKTIIVEDICGCKLQIPNIFTPNNDKHNNTFQIVDYCQTERFEIDIYDRWGKKVFTSKSVNDSWDGYINGVKAANGIYVYKIIYKPFSIKDNIPFVSTQGAFMLAY